MYAYRHNLLEETYAQMPQGSNPTPVIAEKPAADKFFRVNADHSDFEGFFRELQAILPKLGIYVMEDPILAGGDTYGLVLSKTPLDPIKVEQQIKKELGL